MLNAPVLSEQVETAASHSLLLCSTNEELWRDVANVAQHADSDVSITSEFEATEAALRQNAFACCVLDISDCGNQWMSADAELAGDNSVAAVIKHIHSLAPACSVVILTDPDASRDLTASFDDEVVLEIIERPFGLSTLTSTLRRSIQYSMMLAQNLKLREQLSNHAMRDLLGESPPIQWLAERIRQAATHDQTVLILGEPGTGKHLAARAIHNGSRRGTRSFTELNCGVLSSDAFQKSFFGNAPHIEGNYVGASVNFVDGGTVFLSEIDAAPIPVQKRLTRFLEQQQRRSARADSSESRQIRVIASCSDDLKSKVRAGVFSKELYNCLSDTIVETPPLRECRSDIPILANAYLHRLAVQEGRPPMRLAPDAINVLIQYEWPGNVRELHRSLNQAAKIHSGSELSAEGVSTWLTSHFEGDQFSSPEMSLREMERKLIEATFARHNGNRERTAQALQIGIRTLSGKLREYGYPPRGGPGSNLRAA
ncbi:MAG: sigma-54-dependent Fis family transcriptional regulator [Planctomycetaceae bacterium]|nr:sigma-54-dependent Fis family transcriptional regulator [Planctomycetaceae bacterium]